METFELNKDFEKGDRVVYIPYHADGDRNHKDCEFGVVKSISEKFVFVIYDNSSYGKMTTGDEPYTAEATVRGNLMFIDIFLYKCYVCDEDIYIKETGIIQCPKCLKTILAKINEV